MRVLAGIVDERQPPGPGDAASLCDALRGDGGQPRHVIGGRIALGWSAHGPAVHLPRPPAVVLVLVAGHIADHLELAARAGLDPSLGVAHAIAAMWSREGDDLLARLRGEFAVVVWDAEQESGVVAVDHAGASPVVWAATGARTVFASEVRHLLGLLPRRPAPDSDALASWISLGPVPVGRTLYDGVRRVPAGHLLPLGGDSAPPRPYWRPVYAVPPRASLDEAAERVRAAVVTAVRRRSRPGTGVLLSGGLDSGSVAGFAARATDAPPARSYSARFPRHPTVDESPFIDRMCDAYGLENTSIVVEGGSVVGGALDYLEHWELPPVSPNLFFWSPLMKRAAADGIAVLLDGEGGDEVFGASVALLADYLRRARIVSAWRLLDQAPTRNETGLTTRSKRAALRVHGAQAALPLGVERAMTAMWRAPGSPPWLLPATRRAAATALRDGDYRRLDAPRWWSRLVDATLTGAAPAMTAGHAYRRAGQAGVAASHPLLDVDLVHTILALPPELGFDRRTRPLMRLAGAGIVPEEVRGRRDKSPFDALFHEALAGPDLPLVRRLLARPDAVVGTYVDLGQMRSGLLDAGPPEVPAQRRKWAFEVWRLLAAECFLLAQEERRRPRGLLAEAGIAPIHARFEHRPALSRA